jgi:hypothetical protein
MAQAAATNLRALKRDVGNGYVVIGWDDPNTDTKKAAVYVPTSTGAQPYTSDLASRTAVVKGGMTVIIGLGDGSIESKSEPFTVPAATDEPAMTAKAHLEAAMGATYAAGTKLGFITVTKTVNADGSIS